MNIKYFIIRLHILMLSPIFPSLLTFILLIVYKIYFEPVILCDNGSSPLLLDQLKQNLAEEMNTSTIISSNITDTMELQNRWKEAQGKLTPIQTAYVTSLLSGWEDMYIKSLNKTIEIENYIRRIDPSFCSGGQEMSANILRALEENRRR